MRPDAGVYPRRDGVRPRLSMDDVTWFVVHHTGAGPARPSVRDTAAYQTSPGAHIAFPGFAYTMYVEADGTLYLAHDLDVVSWANGDGSPTAIEGVGIYNWLTISCCFSGQDPNSAQAVTIRRAKQLIDAVLGQRLDMKGHRQVSGVNDTECPGDAAIKLLPILDKPLPDQN